MLKAALWEFTLVRMMSAARCQVAADIWTKPSPPVGCQLTTLTIAILLLLNPKAGTHFTVPQNVEGWVDLAGWLQTKMVYPLAHSHSSKY